MAGKGGIGGDCYQGCQVWERNCAMAVRNEALVLVVFFLFSGFSCALYL